MAQDPKQWLWLFVVAGGLSRVLGRVAELPLGEHLPGDVRVPLALIAGPIAGFVLVFGVGRLLHEVLVRMGGTASWLASRTAIAWALAPSVPSVALWAVMLATYGSDVLSPDAAGSFGSHQSVVLSLDYLVQTGLTLWALVLEVILLADAHALRPWRVLIGEAILAVGLLFVVGLLLLVAL